MNFCPVTWMLLSEITSQDKLIFKSDKTGNLYEAKPEHTMLASEDMGELPIFMFKNALHVAAYTPINPKARNPCKKCNRQVVSYMRLGEEKKVIYVCLCGHRWSES